MFNSSVIVLTGAGASIPANIPGMRGMVAEFKESRAKRSKARLAYDQVIQHGIAEDLEEVLQFCNRLAELKQKDLESALVKVAAPRGGNKVKVFRGRLNEQVSAAQFLKQELIKWIGTTCLKFDRDVGREIYTKLLPPIYERKIPIFTTNYDGVLDDAADECGIGISDNFISGKNGRMFWDESHQGFTADGLAIIRMHGSIYWHVTKGADTIEKFRQPAPMNAEGLPVDQLLIFPTRFKDIYEKNYFPLYSAFTRSLGNAKLLIVIGHSLRDEYLLAAVRERLKDPKFALIIVDLIMPPCLRGIEGNLLHLNGSIRTFAPLLARAMRERPDDMIAYLEDAQTAIKRGRTERIRAVEGFPTYASPGETITGKVEISSLAGTYTWGISIRRNKKWISLFRSGSRDQMIDGYGTETREVFYTLPRDVEPGEAYELSVSLFRRGERVAIASQRRKLKIRK